MTTRATPILVTLVLLANALALALALAPAASGQTGTIVNSKHNLSAGGPGAVRAATEQEICIFCHTPHNASPVQPLWNRNMPANAYTVYSSSSLQARPGQPTGSSKLCLSCHDGTIALGSVLSRQQPVVMAGGVTTLPPGATNLGTDLSDDHPISFRFDNELVTKDPKLRSPQGLPQAVRLDANQEMQCTTCHEPHDDTFGKFLVMDNRGSQLCKTCHDRGTTDVVAHDNCNACHRQHTAPSKAFLLTGATAAETCAACHSGQPAANQGANVLADMGKASRHDTRPPVDPREHAPNHVACNDCHEPHTILTGTATAPLASPKLGAVGGVNASGAKVTRVQYEYEVCFTCHADQAGVQPAITRQVVQNNTRLEFAPSAVSSHPVQAAGKNPFVPSLRPGLTTASIIYCTDCHGSDASLKAGGGGPNGPHGSNNRPLLVARYDTADFTTESASAYALCYSCHDRASILANQSFKSHSKHIVEFRTPCSVCHDAHGIGSGQGSALRNAHLINFDTSVVRPDPASGKLEYNSQGPGAGTCTLLCHDSAHSARPYSTTGGALPAVGGVRRGGSRR